LRPLHPRTRNLPSSDVSSTHTSGTRGSSIMSASQEMLYDAERRSSCLYSCGWHPASGSPVPVVEPATGDHLAEVGGANAADVALACSRAWVAQRGWWSRDPSERAAVLNRGAGELE